MRDTRHELIEAAEVLVRTRGYSGFSFAQLSDVVGIKKASVHHYFKTKDDLARALIAAYDKRFDDDLETIKTKSDDAIDRIQAYGTLYVSGVEKSLGCHSRHGDGIRDFARHDARRSLGLFRKAQ